MKNFYDWLFDNNLYSKFYLIDINRRTYDLKEINKVSFYRIKYMDREYAIPYPYHTLKMEKEKLWCINQKKDKNNKLPFKCVLKSKDAKIYKSKIIKYINFDIYLYIYFYLQNFLKEFSIMVFINENNNSMPLFTYIDSTNNVAVNNLLKFGYIFIPYRLSQKANRLKLNVFINGIEACSNDYNLYLGSYFKKFSYIPNIIDYKF